MTRADRYAGSGLKRAVDAVARDGQSKSVSFTSGGHEVEALEYKFQVKVSVEVGDPQLTSFWPEEYKDRAEAEKELQRLAPKLRSSMMEYALENLGEHL